MRISVIGSWDPEKADRWRLKNQKGFLKACLEVGREIARQGHTLMVNSRSSAQSSTAECCVMNAVLGAIDAAVMPSRPLVAFVTSGGEDSGYHETVGRFPGYVADWGTCPVQGRFETRIIQIMESDVLLVLGGARSSSEVGLAAIVGGKRVVSLGAFGGAGKTLLEFVASKKDTSFTKEEIAQLRGAWTPNLKHLVFERIGYCMAPRLLLIHGRGEEFLKVKNLLQNRLHLPEPVIMGERTSPGLTLPEKFEHLANRVDGAIAIVTGDDVGALKVPESTSRVKLTSRARQNVWLEVGWFWGRLGRKKLLLLCKDKTEIPSDLQGWEYHRYREDPAERAEEVREFVDRFRSDLS